MCGVCGVFNHPDAAFLAYLMNFSQQHRGQQGSGVAVDSGKRIRLKKGLGLVDEVFGKGILFSKNAFLNFKGYSAIGHDRYPTAGDTSISNVQPFSQSSIDPGNGLAAQVKFIWNYFFNSDSLALGFNGTIANSNIMRAELESHGVHFKSSSDTEVMFHYLKNGKKPLEERIHDFAEKAIGSYSIVMLQKENGIDRLVAVRDSHGFMPLVLGKMGQTYVVASETRAFDVIHAEYVREIAPGEILSISKDGLHSTFLPKNSPAQCVFQFVYFSMPDSKIFGLESGVVKKNLGVELAKEDSDFISRVNGDPDYVVISIPDSGNIGALGYSQESGIPFEFGIARHHYVGRTFIDNDHFNRDLGVRLKLNTIEGFVKGKKVIVVDDSIVRGTTIKRDVELIRSAGASEIHVRIFSPPYENPCFYGIDTASWNELAAANMNVDQIRDAIGADSLRYLSLSGLLRATESKGNYCTACFTGEYPTQIFVDRLTQPKRDSVFAKP